MWGLSFYDVCFGLGLGVSSSLIVPVHVLL